MIRQEAIEKVDGLEPFDLPTRRQKNELFVDKLVALGILRLDEPKSVEDRLAAAAGESLCLNMTTFLRQIDLAGLKIVEK